MLSALQRPYRDLLSPILKKHEKTLERLDRLMKDGNTAQASHLWRHSGLLDDLAKAIANAGKVSADEIRDAVSRLRKDVHDEATRT